jgi:hypothetical protein
LSGGSVKHKAEKPDWLDVLVSAWITAWVTLVTAQFGLGFGSLMWGGAHDQLVQLFFVTAAFAFWSFFFGIFVTSIVGVPALLLARALRLSKRWHAALIGAFAGLIAILPVALPALGSSAKLVVLWVAVFVVAGGLAGLAARRTMLRRETRV